MKDISIFTVAFFIGGFFWFSLGMSAARPTDEEILFYYKEGYEDCQNSIKVDTSGYITTEFARDFKRYKERQ